MCWGGRPTILWALALSQSSDEQRSEKENLARDESLSQDDRIKEIRQWYKQTNVFEMAQELVDKYQGRAEEIADSIEPDDLRQLFYYLIDSILERPSESVPEPVAIVDLESRVTAGSVFMTSLPRTTPELDALVGMFYPSVTALGQFEEVAAAELSSVARALLDHDQHMTLTVEAHHGTSVDLEVLESNVVATHYARKILLRRRSDNEVVQYGIVRLHLDSLNVTVREEINSQDVPLGRILIQHNILRMVRLLSLWAPILPAEETLSHVFFRPIPGMFWAYGAHLL